MDALKAISEETGVSIDQLLEDSMPQERRVLHVNGNSLVVSEKPA
jgi:hypothetical protein